MIGFTMMFWGVSEPSLGTALSLRGAALTTEGFLAPKGGAQITLYIIGGIIGLGIVGLLITFLPTVYSIYSQREQEVTRVTFRFGAPPSGVKVLAQSYQLGLAQELDQFWHTWEEWFTDMAETHLSNSDVIFYRSSQPSTSWITTAGALLDACSLFSSTVDRQDVPWVQLCFRAGCHTLRDIATDLGIHLASNGSIHVTRAEYDTACEQLSSAGVQLKADREESWQAFASMRNWITLPSRSSYVKLEEAIFSCTDSCSTILPILRPALTPKCSQRAKKRYFHLRGSLPHQRRHLKRTQTWMLQQDNSFPPPFLLKSHVFCRVGMSNVLSMHGFAVCVANPNSHLLSSKSN
jgi:hypothetical protein